MKPGDGLCKPMAAWSRMIMFRTEVGGLRVLVFPDVKGYPCRGAKT